MSTRCILCSGIFTISITGDHTIYLVPGRTYGTHKNLYISLFFTDNNWSYLLWSPVITIFGPDTVSPRNRGAENDENGGVIDRKVVVEVFPPRRSLGVFLHPLLAVVEQNQRGSSSDGSLVLYLMLSYHPSDAVATLRFLI